MSAATSRPPRAIDITWRRADYRLAAFVREAGATIRPAGDVAGCSTCPKSMRGATDYVRAGDRSWSSCIPCAISCGVIEETAESVARRAAERAARAGAAVERNGGRL